MAKKKKLKRAQGGKTNGAAQPSTPTDAEGQIITLDDDEDSGITPTDDGGAIVQLKKDDAIPTADESGFYDNIVEELDQNDLQSLATELHRKIQFDKQSRSKRDKQYEEGIRRTGLGDDAPGGATFNGASKVVHPMLTKGCIDFSARSIKELLPKGAVVKSYIPGKSTKPRVEKAQRKAAYMNWQCMEQMRGLRHEMEQGMTQEPLGGAFYLRCIYDSELKRPVPTGVPIDDVYLPWAASSFYTAERKTYVEHITQFEYERRVKIGLYIDVDSPAPSITPEQTKAAEATDKIEGREQDPYNQDGLRDVYEISTRVELEGKYGMAPYLLYLDETSRELLGVVRNWEEDDDKKEEMCWMVEFGFIPWRGAYPIGLTHVIGSLSAAATGSLRALLDSAHINNMPTAVKVKGANFAGQSQELQPTQLVELTGGIATDDIRKLIMPLPFNPPSMVLFQLLGFLVEEAEGVVKVALDTLVDNANSQLPVGTTLALIEQGMKVLSAIHSRQHAAFAEFLKILHRINRMYLTDEQVLDDTGELMVYRADFQGPMDVIPVSDPEIFTEIQRFAMMQVVMQRSDLHPERYNAYNVEKMILQYTRIPDVEGLLAPQPQITEMNAVNENVALALGRPVQAFPDQDHLGHIQVLFDFLKSPFLGSNPVIAQVFLGPALKHGVEHIVMWYADHMQKLATASVSAAAEQKLEITKLMQYDDTEVRQELDKLFAAISAKDADSKDIEQTLSGLMPVIQQAQQQLQSFQQAAQQAAAAAQNPVAQATIAKADIQAQTDDKKIAAQQQSDQLDAQSRQQASAADDARSQAQTQADDARALRESEIRLQQTGTQQQHEDARAAAGNQTKETINQADNQTAVDISAAEIAAGKHSSVKDGTSVGKASSDT